MSTNELVERINGKGEVDHLDIDDPAVLSDEHVFL